MKPTQWLCVGGAEYEVKLLENNNNKPAGHGYILEQIAIIFCKYEICTILCRVEYLKYKFQKLV